MLEVVTDQKVINKILTQCEKNKQSKHNQLAKIPSDCLTNTAKRLREEATREKKRQELRDEISFFDNIATFAMSGNLLIIHSLLMNNVFKKHLLFLKDCKYQTLASLKKANVDDWLKREYQTAIEALAKHNVVGKDINKALGIYSELTTEKVDPAVVRQRQIMAAEKALGLRQGNDTHFTPATLASRVVELANIKTSDKVLEPSAGIGSIADCIKKYTSHIDCIELNREFVDLLTLKAYNVTWENFLKIIPEPKYDVIIQNPPFSKNQDIQHIKHAYDFLVEGGTLVAIMSKHFLHASDKASGEFVRWIEDKIDHIEVADTPGFDRTKVDCVVVVIRKQHKDKDDFPMVTVNQHQFYYDKAGYYVAEQFENYDYATPPNKLFSCVDGYPTFKEALLATLRLRHVDVD